MFTGIISNLGQFISLQRGREMMLTLKAPEVSIRLQVGDSLAVNGVCLTLMGVNSDGLLSFYISGETQKSSNFSDLSVGALLNLEFPVTPDGFLSGHLVTGHVDGTVRLRSIQRSAGQNRFAFTYQKTEWRPLLVPKGSVSLNGISLTLVEIHTSWFSVEIIPHTAKSTNLHLLKTGERVNLELDFIGKYLYNFVSPLMGKIR